MSSGKKRKAENGKRTTTSAPQPLAIEYVPRSSLERYAANARTHSPEQVKQIAASIEQFGFTNPILIRGKTILAGHGRFAASEQLALETVPIIRLDHLTETQARALVLADNKLALNAGWDEDLLRAELAALNDNYDRIDELGWSDKELAILLTPPEPEPTGGGINIPETFALHITLTSEAEQKLLYEELARRGLECKVITT
jgi:ParB-like chromosome segregation protein Spo0J